MLVFEHWLRANLDEFEVCIQGKCRGVATHGHSCEYAVRVREDFAGMSRALLSDARLAIRSARKRPAEDDTPRGWTWRFRQVVAIARRQIADFDEGLAKAALAEAEQRAEAAGRSEVSHAG